MTAAFGAAIAIAGWACDGEDTRRAGLKLNLVALDERTGDEIWRARAPMTEAIPPVVAGSTLVVQGDRGSRVKSNGAVTGDSALAGFAAQTGTKTWEAETSADIGPTLGFGCHGIEHCNIAVVEEEPAIVFVREREALHALDAATGDEQWRVPLAPLPYNMPYERQLAAGSGMVLALAGGEIHAFGARDGVERWILPAEPSFLNDNIRWLSRVDGGTVFFNSAERIQAIDVTTGTELWQRRFTKRTEGDQGAFNHRPLAGGGILIINTYPEEQQGACGRVTALDSRSGKELWVRNDACYEAIGKDAVYLAGYRVGACVFAGGNCWLGRVTAVGLRSGVPLWQHEEDETVSFHPVVAGDTTVIVAQVLVPQPDGTDVRVVALDVSTGRVVWDRKVARPAEPHDTNPGGVSASVADGVVYVAHGVFKYVPPTPGD